jgi:hypothetical protein
MNRPEINVWKYDIIIVCYHEDWCTKNKRMFWIPMRGLFLSCTENSFLFCTHIKNKADAYLKEVSYLERRSLVRREFPILSGPLLEVNCPCAACISLAPCTRFPPIEHLFYIKTPLTSPILLSGTRIYFILSGFCYFLLL